MKSIRESRYLSYRLAVACGAIPLVFGIGVFALWWVTRWEFLMMGGFFTIVFGLVCVAVGAIALIDMGFRGRAGPECDRLQLRKQLTLASLLLLVNFPVAYLLTVVGLSSDSELKVVICNSSDEPLHKVRIWGGGISEELPIIRPGSRREIEGYISADGIILFSASSTSNTYQQPISNYVSNLDAGEIVVIVGPNGTILFHEDVGTWPHRVGQ